MLIERYYCIANLAEQESSIYYRQVLKGSAQPICLSACQGFGECRPTGCKCSSSYLGGNCAYKINQLRTDETTSIVIYPGIYTYVSIAIESRSI